MREIRVKSKAGDEWHESTLTGFKLCTGVVDVNGEDIWEGDKVKFWGGVGEVVYVEDTCSFKIECVLQLAGGKLVDYFDLFNREMEVIKNDGLQ